MRPLTVACGVALVQVLTAASFHESGQTNPQFASRTDLIVLDVSVLDAQRRPVRGLTAADFVINERGARQKITSFKAVDVPDTPVVTAPWMRDAVFDVQDNRAAGGRLVVLFMDDRFPPAMGIQAVRNASSEFIKQLAPTDLAAVVYSNRYQNSQEFTTDRGRLLAAVAKYDHFLGPISPTRGLGDLGKVLAQVPNRQKLVVYFGRGQEFDPLTLARIYYLTADQGSNDMVMAAHEGPNPRIGPRIG